MHNTGNINIEHVVRGGLWLYGVTVVQSIAGSLYWLIISAIGGPSVLGYTSAIVSLSVLVTSLLSLGIDFSVQRFIGRSLGRNDRESIQSYFWTSAIIFLITHVVASALLLALGLAGLSLGNITPKMLILTSLLIFLNYNLLFHGVFIAFIKTDLLLISTIVGNVLRFIVGIPLVIYGWGWVGATLGYACPLFTIVSAGTLFAIRKMGLKIVFSLAKAKEILVAGLAVWFPKTIFTVGQWSSVIVVFGFLGALETGKYYIAFAISSMVLMASISMIRILLPVLSGMTDGRKRMGWKVLKISLTIATPLLFILLAYPSIPLSILGKEYVAASETLRILLVATIPLAITHTVTNLAFSYGMYMKVLEIGLYQNVPRLILYLTLAKTMGGLGVAASYLIGSVAGLASSLKIANHIGFKIKWKELGKIITIPLAISILAYITPLTLWPIISLTIIALSSISYIKLNVISKEELKELLISIRPKTIAAKIDPIIDKLLNKLYGKW